ncbi:MAG: c-type cytochrome [Henriciella sp.]|nr:c-type cytochrome [Henriciella sp.]MBO6693880.1 c-type cytochrome [Henriciella sp.]
MKFWVGANALLMAAILAGCSSVQPSAEVENPEVEETEVAIADALEVASRPEAHYQTYCALCHAENREGYKNDHAPSLKTETLFALGPMVPSMATAYGRPGTPMGPYLDDLGGPLTQEEIQTLAAWLNTEAGYPTRPPEGTSLMPISGDIELGAQIYQEQCATCHGANGEGGTGTALGNVTMLATSPDVFLKAAIVKGRNDTAMPAFENTLAETEIDAVVAFLRSRAQGWDASSMKFDTPPPLDQIVLNPEGPDPNFVLEDDRYVSAEALNAELEAGAKMILVDTRVPYFWAMAHIRGSVPVPYYSSREEFISALPNDGTWIVAYCECPRAAADSAVTALRKLGFENTAVLYEGYAGWAASGYPISVGSVPEKN